MRKDRALCGSQEGQGCFGICLRANIYLTIAAGMGVVWGVLAGLVSGSVMYGGLAGVTAFWMSILVLGLCVAAGRQGE